MPRIEKIDLYRVAMPLLSPYGTSFGLEQNIESVLVRMEAGGVTGWGEAASWSHPGYCGECAATQFLIGRDFLAPRLLGQTLEGGDALQARLSCVKGNEFAKAQFDLAFWDLQARRAATPLWRLIGGKNQVVETGAAYGTMERVEDLLACIEGALAEGYTRVKLKYHPGWDLFMLRAVRKAFPDAVFHIDCNSAYRLSDLEMFKAIDDLHLAMIEQPLACDDLLDHAKLQQAIRTPVCLDESIHNVDHARHAVEVGACRWVNIKPGRVGGVTVALAIHDYLEQHSIPCWIGGMIESAVGQSHMVALATLSNIHYPSDILPTHRFYAQDLCTQGMVHSGPSQFRATDAPGIGVEPDPDRLARFTVESARLHLT